MEHKPIKRTRSATPSKLEPKTRLNRSLVLARALEIADREGIQALTMRKLAQELAVEAMSLYHHVANKVELLDGIIDLVFAEIDVPVLAQGWRQALRARACSAREALVRHPWAIALMDSRTAPGPAAMKNHNAVLGCLREGGFTLSAAAHAYSVLDSYIYGFVLQQVNLPFSSVDEIAEFRTNMVAQMPTDEYPYLTEMVLELDLQPGYVYADEFEIGLDLILDVIERLKVG